MKNFKTKIALLILLLISIINQESIGQENETTGSKFGLGVSLFNFSWYEEFSSIYVTIDLGKNFRIEPLVGIALEDGFEDYFLGIGAFGKKPISKFNILYGLRLGLDNDDVVLIAPAIAGEYYFIKNFSIGSEVQLRGLILHGDWYVYTNTSVLFRFYF